MSTPRRRCRGDPDRTGSRRIDDRAWRGLDYIQGSQVERVCGPALSPPTCLRQSRNRSQDEQSTHDRRWREIMADKLNGYRILILETREEAQFSRLLAEQGADVLQCPMFTIHDAPEPEPIEAWITRSIDKPFDDLVLMTAEDLRRLIKVLRRIAVQPDFIPPLRTPPQLTHTPQPR